MLLYLLKISTNTLVVRFFIIAVHCISHMTKFLVDIFYKASDSELVTFSILTTCFAHERYSFFSFALKALAIWTIQRAFFRLKLFYFSSGVGCHLSQWARAISRLVLPLFFLVPFRLLFVIRVCTLVVGKACAWLPVSTSICSTPQVSVQCWQLEDSITVQLSISTSFLSETMKYCRKRYGDAVPL